MTALIAEFDSNLPQECNVERLAIYLQIEKVAVGAETPGAAEIQELDAVLKEIFPEPRTADTSKAIGKIKTILSKQSIPSLAGALKATTANQRQEIARGVLRATDDDTTDIILSFAELAIRFSQGK